MNFLHKLLSFALELIGTSLNLLLLSTISIISLLFTLPTCLAFKLFTFLKGLMFPEDIAGKVVVVTGAASGIGEQIAYEYARRSGACLALVDIRENHLEPVVEKTKNLGSPDVIGIGADVSKVEDCERFINATANHFGRLDHLVNNTGIARGGPFEKVENISELTPIMDINFWGAVYGTHFAMPHLKKSKGKIIITASASGWFPFPGLTIYGGSKAALIGFFETLRCELIGSNVGITIVTPGYINSPMTRQRALPLFGRMIRFGSVEECGKAIVRSACRGDRYLVIPSWYNLLFPLKLACSEVIEFFNYHLFFKRRLRKKASSS